MELENLIFDELKIELSTDEMLNENILLVKVKSAIREVKFKRNYSATRMTEEEIEKDLENYYSTIKNIALYDYNQTGVEGESSHNENSVSRQYVDRDSLFKGVHAFVKVL